ncbi:MAG: SulP family inorganic anion transporter [Burkholderiales bacterium]|jgi:SulP family sulfate permease
MFRPRLIDALRHYRREDLAADVGAGVTVGVVALPLAMAFGIASGVSPESGLFTAIVAGLIISALGGSRVQIGGPAGAFVVLLYAIVERYGLANLLLSTMFAGVLLFAMGALRLGRLIRFIPVSIVIGFTNGIAVIIAFQQVRDFLGLSIERMPANFFSQIQTLAAAAGTVHLPAVLLGMASLLLVTLWPKSYLPNDAQWRKVLARMPGTVAVLVLGALAVHLGLSVETIGSRFGGIPQGLPALAFPEFDWSTAQMLAAPTLSIALLGAIESLLCARVADTMTGDRHDPNQELMAQGIANMAAPLFGGIAATGTIARTVTNVRAGARTPVAGIIHALTLLAILMVLAPVAGNIPLASLAAILLYVAWGMADWKAFGELHRYSLSYRLILLSTFVLTVIFDITVAVEVGLGMAGLFFIHRVSRLTRLEPVTLSADQAQTPAGGRIELWRVFGSLFFGSVDRLEVLSAPGREVPQVLVLDMHQVINLDTSALEALQELHTHLQRQGGRLLIAELTGQPLSLIQRSGFLDQLGRDALFGRLDEALAAARTGTPVEPALAE